MKYSAFVFFLGTFLFSLNSYSQTTTIPDPNFEQALIDLGYDTGTPDGGVPTTNISNVTSLNVFNKSISDLTGIEDFAALTYLLCNGNLLTSLNVTQNTALTDLFCTNNQITSIDVSQNTLLEVFYCDKNQLASLDVSQNTVLTDLFCGENQLTSLDVTQNTALIKLSCFNNQLSSLDVTQNSILTDLDNRNNPVTSIDVTQNLALEDLYCSNNQLTNLDVTQNTALINLSCNDNQLTNLNVTQNPNITFLNCRNNLLTSLDVTQITALYSLNCEGNNQITSLDVTQNSALYTLRCSSNQLTSLDVSQNPALNLFFCSFNNIPSLDVTQNPALTALYCIGNPISTLDLSQNVALTSIYCSSTLLSSLDLTQNIALNSVSIHSNPLLQCVNIKNGQNTNILGFSGYNNPSLYCIEVDSALYSAANWTNIDAHTSYNSYCFCQSGFNTINGNVQLDNSVNCIGEGALNQHILKTSDGNYNMSDVNGDYVLYADSGTVDVEQLPPNTPLFLGQTCPSNPNNHTVTFNGIGLDTTGINFYNEFALCPYLTVDISSNLRRRCFTNNTIIKYCNEGYADTNNVEVHVDFPSYVNLISADHPYTIDANGNYVFSIGVLNQGQCGTINIIDSVSCVGNVTGLTQCTRAWITPSNDCVFNLNPDIALWDSSSVSISGSCLGDSIVRFVIYNNGNPGTGDMTSVSDYRIYADGSLAYTSTFQLNGGDSLVLTIAATGETMRIEADQNIGHPGNSNPNFVLEACGSVAPSLGYVSQYPNDDNDRDNEIDCLPIVDSYDPNDKQVQPVGLTTQHYVQPNQLQDYKIRFQNTGSAPAFTVVIVDTLSPYLDPSTIEWGISSHDYVPSVIGQGVPVLMFTFNNINLPDSTSDELGSQGFVKFKIAPYDSLPNGTEIHNEADIYFDYNDPIITNDVWVTLHDTTLTGGSITFYDSIGTNIHESNFAEQIVVMPNPTNGNITIDLGKVYKNFSITLTNTLGQVVLNEKVTQMNRLDIEIPGSSGLYFLNVVSDEGERAVVRVLKEK